MNALQQIEAKLRGVQCADPACNALIDAVLEIAREALAKGDGPCPKYAEIAAKAASVAKLATHALIETHPDSTELARQLQTGELARRLVWIGPGFDPNGRVAALLAAQDLLAAIPAAHERQGPNAIAGAGEFCICAAIKMPSGEVIYGHRHNHCYDVVRARPAVSREDIVAAEQGFVTSTGRFVGREEGMAIQKASGRPSCYGRDGAYIGDALFSEDLYATPESARPEIPGRGEEKP